MTKEEKLSAIQEEMGSKELKFGCEIRRYSKYKDLHKSTWTVIRVNEAGMHIINSVFGIERCRFASEGEFRILGTPVDLTRVKDQIEEKTHHRLRDDYLDKKFTDDKEGRTVTLGQILLDHWSDEPLLRDQSEETIDFIYDLTHKK